MIKCPICNSELPEDTIYCHHCGTMFDSAQVDTIETEQLGLTPQDEISEPEASEVDLDSDFESEKDIDWDDSIENEDLENEEQAQDAGKTDMKNDSTLDPKEGAQENEDLIEFIIDEGGNGKELVGFYDNGMKDHSPRTE